MPCNGEGLTTLHAEDDTRILIYMMTGPRSEEEAVKMILDPTTSSLQKELLSICGGCQKICASNYTFEDPDGIGV